LGGKRALSIARRMELWTGGSGEYKEIPGLQGVMGGGLSSRLKKGGGEKEGREGPRG